MKSTLKIDYSSRSDSSIPVVKIIQPADSFNDTTESDFDVRDKLIRDFLVRPGYCDRNYWFNLDTCFGNDHDNPTLFISTIAAIKEEDLLEKFKWALLNRYVPYNSLTQLRMPRPEVDPDIETQAIAGENKFYRINEFFDWLISHEQATWHEQQPEHIDSCRTRP